ncbi:MAG: hypothetical protein ACFE7R_09590, partial [Candidatus Hodarchaeota archaeon]
MVAITPLTLIFEFMSPLLVTFLYLIFFGNRRSRLIEAFIVLMYLKMATSFLYYIWYLPTYLGSGFDSTVSGSLLGWTFLLDLVFQFTYTLQDYLTWVMVSFFAVLFGMVVLALKLTLQDPLKMRFKNVLRRVIGREPESDGYAGLRHRLDNIRFEGLEPQPLDPQVQTRAYKEAWRDYLIIGLATLLPSIGAYLGGIVNYIAYRNTGNLEYAPNLYILGVFIFLTWIYRFGYPASNRIAKGAGMKLGDRDLGEEMMRGVLGWFFRLNLLFSVYIIVTSVFNALSAPLLTDILGLNQGQILNYVGQYFSDGLIQAFPPILFAILILPLTEDFAVVLYKKAFDWFAKAKSKARGLHLRTTIANFVGAVGTGGIVTGAFVGAIAGVTLHYSFTRMGTFLFKPGNVDGHVSNALVSPSNNAALIPPTIWTLLILAIPFACMILIGLIGHVIKSRTGGSAESFAVVASLIVVIAVAYILPGMDYIL